MHTVKAFFWQKLRERVLIAGTYDRSSSGTLLKSPRWGVSMNHVARQGDPTDDETEWKASGSEQE